MQWRQRMEMKVQAWILVITAPERRRSWEVWLRYMPSWRVMIPRDISVLSPRILLTLTLRNSRECNLSRLDHDGPRG